MSSPVWDRRRANVRARRPRRLWHKLRAQGWTITLTPVPSPDTVARLWLDGWRTEVHRQHAHFTLTLNPPPAAVRSTR